MSLKTSGTQVAGDLKCLKDKRLPGNAESLF